MELKLTILTSDKTIWKIEDQFSFFGFLSTRNRGLLVERNPNRTQSIIKYEQVDLNILQKNDIKKGQYQTSILFIPPSPAPSRLDVFFPICRQGRNI